jgi:nitrite reductase/ring-hydroxylating ferredoxin subunit
MQSFDTDSDGIEETAQTGQIIAVGSVEDVPPGHSVIVELSNGRELALFNVEGEFHAIDNFCPHKGASLASGHLQGHTVECDWHGWQFDVRTGNCLTVREQVKVYRVIVEDGLIKVEI